MNGLCRHPATKILRAGELALEVMVPDAPQRYNTGVRYCSIAAVLGCCWQGREFFFNPRRHDPTVDHGGLAAEFDLQTPGGPPGYAEAEPGMTFLKIGVGTLRRDDAPYRFARQYELVDPAENQVEWEDRQARFHQVANGPRGYAYALTAILEADPGVISVHWNLENTGSRRLSTRQYVHNFFRFGDRNIGPEYEICFPYAFKASGLVSQTAQEGACIAFHDPLPAPINLVVPWPESYEGPNELTVRQTGGDQAIRCRTSEPGVETRIHARRGYVAPEQFIQLDAEPGETITWQRLYTLQCRA